jgi:hypothetical protein
MACPACRGALTWNPESASCPGCGAVYPRIGGYWDFTVTARHPVSATATDDAHS